MRPTCTWCTNYLPSFSCLQFFEIGVPTEHLRHMKWVDLATLNKKKCQHEHFLWFPLLLATYLAHVSVVKVGGHVPREDKNLGLMVVGK